MATTGRPKSRSKDKRYSLDVRDTGFPSSFVETTPHESHHRVSDSGSSTAQQLQRDILKLQDELKILSASRVQDRRQSIRQALEADDYSLGNFSDNFDLCAMRAASDQSPRASATREGERESGEFSNPLPSVSATEQSRNVKVKLSARKSANSSKRRPLATAVESDRSTGHGAFGDAAEAGSSQPVQAGATVEATWGTLIKAEMMTEPSLKKL